MLGAEMAIALKPINANDNRIQQRSSPASDRFPFFAKQNVMTHSSFRTILCSDVVHLARKKRHILFPLQTSEWWRKQNGTSLDAPREVRRMNLKGNNEGGEAARRQCLFIAPFAFKFPTLSRDATQTRRWLRLLATDSRG